MPRTFLQVKAIVFLDDLPVVCEAVPAELVDAMYTCNPKGVSANAVNDLSDIYDFAPRRHFSARKSCAYT
jgi:hypothetical protein